MCRWGAVWLAGLLLWAAAGPAGAGELVVAACRDRSGAGMGRRVVVRLRQALRAEGRSLTGYRAYLKRARQLRLARRALRPQAIRRLARDMQLDGVLTCRARKVGQRFQIAFYLYGPDGRVALQKAYRNTRPWLRKATIGELAAAVIGALGATPAAADEGAGGHEHGDVALVPLVPVDAAGQDGERAAAEDEPAAGGPEAAAAADAPAPAGEDERDDVALVPLAPVAEDEAAGDEAAGDEAAGDEAAGDEAAGDAATAAEAPRAGAAAAAGPQDAAQRAQWARLLEKNRPRSEAAAGGAGAAAADAAGDGAADDTGHGAAGGSGTAAATGQRAASPAAAGIEQPAAPSAPPGPPGPVPQLWLAVGSSMLQRAGLSPRYQADPFPGLRVAGRLFGGAFTELAFLRDLGLEGYFERGFGLKYASAVRPEKLAAHVQHWTAGLAYRLDFEHLLERTITTGPTVLLRGGYGATASAIDEKFDDVLSARYTYTYAGLGLHLWLWRPWLGLALRADGLIDVWAADRLAGAGHGLRFGAQVFAELFGAVHLSAGYEQLQFVFDERALGETSDRYQSLFLRVGWSHR
jgi:hypothetical protein